MVEWPAAWRGRVSVFGSWDVFPYIFNCDRSRLPVWPAWEPRFAAEEIPARETIMALMRDTTPIWDDLTYDSFLFHATADYLHQKHRA